MGRTREKQKGQTPRTRSRFGPGAPRNQLRTDRRLPPEPFATRIHAFRAVLAKNDENTDSTFVEAHLGHLIRFRPRSVMPIVNANVFLQVRQRKS